MSARKSVRLPGDSFDTDDLVDLGNEMIGRFSHDNEVLARAILQMRPFECDRFSGVDKLHFQSHVWADEEGRSRYIVSCAGRSRGYVMFDIETATWFGSEGDREGMHSSLREVISHWLNDVDMRELCNKGLVTYALNKVGGG
jgi:hypothetical protein